MAYRWLCQRRRHAPAHDALVLKWVAMQIETSLPRPAHCHHLKGRGGVSGSTARVAAAWHDPRWRYVYRTDIRGYYRHILKHQVDSQLHWHVSDPVCRDLCRQWLYYSIEDGGEIHTPEKGICHGSALSPLIGGSLLRHVDHHFGGREGLFMRGTWMTLLFLRKGAGNCARRLSNCMNFLTWVALRRTRIKPNWGRLSMDLTGWGCGMPVKGPG